MGYCGKDEKCGLYRIHVTFAFATIILTDCIRITKTEEKNALLPYKRNHLYPHHPGENMKQHDKNHM